MARVIKEIREIKFDLSTMSNYTKQLIGCSVYKSLIEHFNNPENQKRFKQWQKERRRKAKEEAEKELKGGAE